MKKLVVLYNLDRNEYLSSLINIQLDKKWEKAKFFKNEESAITSLRQSSNRLLKLDLNNWCTRTFYKL